MVKTNKEDNDKIMLLIPDKIELMREPEKRKYEKLLKQKESE